MRVELAVHDHPDLHARNVFMRGVGHLSLPIDSRVTREIAVTLAHLDTQGTTVSAGLSRLPPGDGPTTPQASQPPRPSRLRGRRRSASAG